MIWILTPNPAIDITYPVPHVELHQVHRVDSPRELPGGKGVNVARVLAQLGVASTSVGFLGGSNGIIFKELFAQVAAKPGMTLLHSHWIDIPGQTRRSIAITDTEDATVFNEAGPSVSAAQWRELTDFLAQSLAPGDVLACCGSLPPESDPKIIAELVKLAHSRQTKVIVDAAGPAAFYAAQAGVDLLKPNRNELCQAFDQPQWQQAIKQALNAGARCLAVSAGEEGIVVAASTIKEPEKTRVGIAFKACPWRTLTGNPTGAGDASTAAWCLALSAKSRQQDQQTGAILPQMAPPATPIFPASTLASTLFSYLPMAVALSAAAVVRPVAGEVDLAVFKEFYPHIKQEEICL